MVEARDNQSQGTRSTFPECRGSTAWSWATRTVEIRTKTSSSGARKDFEAAEFKNDERKQAQEKKSVDPGAQVMVAFSDGGVNTVAPYSKAIIC